MWGAKVIIPEQNTKSGGLILDMQEGQLSNIVLNNPNLKNTVNIPIAYPRILGKPLNLRDTEQGLDNINRMQSHKVTSAIIAGKKAGDSIVKISTKQSKPWNVVLSYDNLSSETAGENNYKITYTHDNLLGLNDILKLSYKRSMDFDVSNLQRKIHDYQNSDAYTYDHSFTYGYYLFGISVSDNENNYEINNSTKKTYSKGVSKNYNVFASRIIDKTQISKTKIKANIAMNNQENYILNALIGVSSYDLTILSLSLNNEYTINSGKVTTDVSLHKGLRNTLGSTDNPKGDFGILKLAVSILKIFDVKGHKLSLSRTISGQYTQDTIFGFQKMSLGDFSSVRGVKKCDCLWA